MEDVNEVVHLPFGVRNQTKDWAASSASDRPTEGVGLKLGEGIQGKSETPSKNLQCVTNNQGLG